MRHRAAPGAAAGRNGAARTRINLCSRRARHAALHLIQANYQAGLATYLDVLVADAQYHQAKIADIQAIAVRYQDTVALFAALGGGWWNAVGGEISAAAAAPAAP